MKTWLKAIAGWSDLIDLLLFVLGVLGTIWGIASHTTIILMVALPVALLAGATTLRTLTRA